jgi:peroxiredoxin Q/BCP
MVKVGDDAPHFSLPDDQGNTVSLDHFKGDKFILYFYPKDDTPGCTAEACEFRDEYTEFRTRGIVIVGVSADSPESHAKFKAKYNLNFPLLSDPDRTVIKAYGVWKEKSMYGKKYKGIERTTFIIADGKVVKIFPRVKVTGHIATILKVFGELRSPNRPKAKVAKA